MCPVLGASTDAAAGGEGSAGRGTVAGLGLARFVARTWSALGRWSARAVRQRLWPLAGSFPAGHFGPVLRLLFVFGCGLVRVLKAGAPPSRRAESCV